MDSTVATTTLLPHSSLIKLKPSDAKPRICFVAENTNNPFSVIKNDIQSISHLSTFPCHVCIKRNAGFHLSPKAISHSSVVSLGYAEEFETKVKFQTSLSLPGCFSSLSLLGTGNRKKVFAIIGAKVYAAGFYTNQSIFSKMRGEDVHLQRYKRIHHFSCNFSAPPEKSLHIILIRDVDGKTFWDALDEAISPRITSPTPVDESALSTFQSIFRGRPLKKGTSIFLTWLNTTKMFVCIASQRIPSSVDATIESSNVTYALFDTFLGGNPVSALLKASTSTGLAAALE